MLIGLSGRAQAGKTTIAKMLESVYSYKVLSYATPLKKALVELTGLPMKYFTDPKLKKEAIIFKNSPRELMQMMGTEFVREMIDEDFWVWRMEEELRHLNGEENLVIDDCRFENELQLVRDNGGIVIHLVRQHKTISRAHRSEQKLVLKDDDFIINSGNEDEFFTFEKVRDIILRGDSLETLP